MAMATDPPPSAAVSTALWYHFTGPWFPGSATPFQVPSQVAEPVWAQNGLLTYYYSDPRWPDRQGFWAVSDQCRQRHNGRLDNMYSPAEKQEVVIAADIRTNDPTSNVWNVVVQPPPGDGATHPPYPRPSPGRVSKSGWLNLIHLAAGHRAGRRFHDIAITLKTGAVARITSSLTTWSSTH
jgi:hypothetical protein